jgi:hypothetical protein
MAIFCSFFGLTFSILVSCGGGGGGGGSSTETGIPSISNLRYSPQTVTQNQGGGAVRVTATIDFIDQEGDLATLTINVYNAQGVLVATGSPSLQNVLGRTSDSIQIYQDVSTANIVDYPFDIYVTDAKGNVSNTLTGTFRVVATIDPIYEKTLLLRGKWHFVFTIIDTWTSDYSLSTISTTTNDQGGYYIFGKNQWGNLVNATYWPTDGNWSLLDTGTIIDKFYTFYTDGATILPNSCYYQIDKSTGNWSRCYPLSGIKTAQNPDMAINEDESSKILSEEALLLENTTFAPIDDDTKDKYMELKNRISQGRESSK